tara:strand:- start:1515 stop:1985 length:471 start_codon:yes stop_codon:yes gene_type:complete
MTDTKVIVFDIDGTLADVEHRRHYVNCASRKDRNWPAFNAAMVDDAPMNDIIWMLKTFKDAGCTIIIASGRGDRDHDKTVDWLRDVAGVDGLYEKLYMRSDTTENGTSDYIVKKRILDDMRADGYDPYMTVDDRDQVVSMWRDNGIRCLQVAPGDF